MTAIDIDLGLISLAVLYFGGIHRPSDGILLLFFFKFFSPSRRIRFSAYCVAW